MESKIIQKIKFLMLGVLSSSVLAGAFLAPPASAIDLWPGCDANSSTEVCKAADNDDAQSLARNIVSTLLWIIGVVAVIMIVIGGIKFVTANGDSNSIQSAKNTILYAVIGLVVAMLGQAIVFFVVNQFS